MDQVDTVDWKSVLRFDLPVPAFFIPIGIICLAPILLLAYLESSHSSAQGSNPKGCRKLGIRSRSNLHDELNDSKFASGITSGKDGSGEPLWRVKALFMYPIKSCAPLELDAADVVETGFKYDRQFCFAELLTPQTRLDASEEEKAPKWTFRTQRADKFNKLAKVRAEIWVPDPKSATYWPSREEVKSGGVLVVNYPFEAKGALRSLAKIAVALGLLPSERSFRVPLVPQKNHDYPVENVKVWRDTPVWLNMGKHVPQELKDYLGVESPFSLFRADPESYRQVFRCAPRKEDIGYQPSIGFADAYPLHMLNLASVRDIAGRVKGHIPKFSARRFRSNVLITGPLPYQEDSWKRVRIGQYEHYCACRTVRCRLPNVDPDTAFRHPIEPDKTLKSFRCIDEGDPKNACLGLQMVPALSECTVRVGDPVEVLETGKHLYIPQSGQVPQNASPT